MTKFQLEARLERVLDQLEEDDTVNAVVLLALTDEGLIRTVDIDHQTSETAAHLSLHLDVLRSTIVDSVKEAM